MAHESNNNNVLWYIDSIQPIGVTYKVTGWISHKTSDIISLSLGDQDIKYSIINRPDVRSVYPSFNTFGFEFTAHKNDIKKPINVHLKNETIYNIGNLEAQYILKSGFTNSPKGLVVVDNFYNDPDSLRDYVIKNVTFDFSTYHTGRRSIDRFILDGTKEKFEEILGRPIHNWNHPTYANGKFQYCTSHDRVVYHIDTQNYAAMVYLTPDAPLQTGTASYRSKLTGATRFENGETGELYEKTFKGVSNELNFYDKTTWEEVDRVANVYNRLVMFDSKRLHSATEYFGDALENARLFHLFFFDI